MGWSYTQNATRADVIRKLTAPSSSLATLKSTVVGNALWAVQQTPDGERFIALYLLQGDKGYGWGYKGMTESAGPYTYSCPLNYFTLVPEAPNDYARDWREKVKQYHQEKRSVRALKAGDTFTLRPTWDVKGTFRLVATKPLRAQHLATGIVYRLKSTSIDTNSINRGSDV
jgi:hypothetical protein